jgi:signal transduction histidine kinase
VTDVSMRAQVSGLVHRAGGLRLLLFDTVVAGGAAWVGTQGTQKSVLLPWLTGLVLFAALLMRRHHPLVTIVVVCAAMLLGVNIVAAVVAVYTLAARRGPVALTWLMTAVTTVVWLWPMGPRWSTDWMYVLLAIGVFIAVPLLAGLWMFQRTRLLEALRDRAEHAERERDLLATQAVTAERRRIAGEMHDVVAHRVGVIAVQAGALTVVSDDERTGQIAEVIRKSSTAALAELRDVLRVLRADDPDAADVSPPPGVDGVRTLIEDARGAGTVIDLDLPDTLPHTSAPVGRAAYRVVQEALTNVGKHAPGAQARVVLTATNNDLVVEVADTGASARAAAAAGRTALPTSGYGLLGMRERVAQAGGSVTSGRTDGGGYLVRAVFPLRQDDETP